jgi:hypothetical protein
MLYLGTISAFVKSIAPNLSPPAYYKDTAFQVLRQNISNFIKIDRIASYFLQYLVD